MTKEEALEVLDTIPTISEQVDALEMAIKALEQESCEDAVSRKDVHDMLENLPVTVENHWFNWLQKACIRLADLPPVTPQPKIGRWIVKEGFDGDEYYDCSECGESFCLIDGTPTDNLYNYCPNCGARMAESEE